MIKSMTGFGRGEFSDENFKFTVELKSVNHRYLDLNIKMPKKLNAFEASIRNTIKDSVKRGKMDVFITYEDLSGKSNLVKYNKVIAGEYLAYLKEMAEDFGIENDIRVSALSRYPEVFSMEEETQDENEMWAVLSEALKLALVQFVAAREKEGQSLFDDLTAKLDHMLTNVDKVEERAPQIVAEYRQKLNEKVAELLGDTQIDEGRLASEIVLFADKICTDEETVRLRSHINNMKDILKGGDEIGRRLDFVAQEMNRESNTILSKANDLTTSNIAIELKTEVEKIREQIQNLE